MGRCTYFGGNDLSATEFKLTSYGAGGSNKPRYTAAGAGHVIASTTVLTVAFFRAKLSVKSNRALFRASI